LQRHLGSDGLFVFWLIFVLMALSLLTVVPMWLIDLNDEQQLCGASMSCASNVVLTLPFTVGTGLMLRGTYPENFGSSLLLPEADPDDDDAS